MAHLLAWKRYVEAPHGLTELSVVAAQAWQRLLEEVPEEILRKTQVSVGAGTPDGFTRKTVADGTSDSKCYMHVTHEWLQGRHVQTMNQRHGAFASFTKAARLLHNALENPARRFISQLEDSSGNIIRELFMRRGGTPFLILRFLHYDPAPPDSSEYTLAKAHTDSSGFTFPLWASHPGLQWYIDGTWRDVESPRGFMPMFIGDTLSNELGGALQATKHRVVARVGGHERRQSIICFCDPRREGGW